MFLFIFSGESVPITKTPLPNSGAPAVESNQSDHPDVKFHMKDHAKHVLFCGTEVIQTRFYGNQKVKAVVIRTGNNFDIYIYQLSVFFRKFAIHCCQ